MALRVPVRGSEDGGGGSGAEGEGGELVEVLLPGDARAGEAAQGRLLHAGGVLAGDDESVVDLAGVDHVRGQGHAVDEPEARVGDVEVHRVRAQPDPGVDADGHGRLEVLAGHRGVDHEADRRRFDSSLGQRLAAGGDGTGDEVARLVPVAAGLDTGHALEETRGQAEGCEGIGEALVEFVGGHFIRGDDLGQTEKRHVRVPESCVAVRQLRFSSLFGSFVDVCLGRLPARGGRCRAEEVRGLS